ncbi:BTAD domain-containing putative transcriptional regulator [Actinoplanes sp. Pm04-4]|uniref:BTAD domain-containing putative transcriptional regulator n=1 Tax=Paractinoplanes pyxinae TaxID=2997416 RepID=A0ABT4BF07_9ACTN|nr:BTAD domain-containing putative transcriptional regulator [Actinoplanes pyxinae]MCY1145036.1 BTAD domain-containing putative transcriptional regulator [Actinoplanes pyxinae]
MEVRLLGPVEVHAAGRVWDAGPRQQRHVLAALAADAGRPLTAETLIDRVWDEAPNGARRALHVHITRIRRLLEQIGDGATLSRRSGGYLLEAATDRHSFRSLTEQARRLPADRVALLGRARELWRGEPLTGLTGEWATQCRRSWRPEYLEATESWARAQLEDGVFEPVIPVLTGLSGEEPFAESIAALLMRALHAAGRSAEAAQFYLSWRQRLVDELGIDPGPQLQELHQAILRQEVPVPGTKAPAQLPLDVRGFTGRSDELAQLDETLATADDQPTAVIVSALSGTAGVGKTALAVHWAHRVAACFPDGQLYMNLRGFGPDGAVVTPADAVRGFLYALQVPPQQLPAGLDAQTALYRSLLAGKRVLVVLDNARDAAQVRSLLPGTAGCLVLVTSRNQLTGLVAAEGAHPVQLDLLSPAEARGLLARRLGEKRVAAEPIAVDGIIAACARLPLAIVVAAARAATRPALPLAALAEELNEAGGVPDALAGARAIFSWSYRALDAETADLFRLLGRHPGPDVTTPAAASLVGLSLTRTRNLLNRLADAHLITEHSPGRFNLHDLLRAYAAELSRNEDSQAATTRLLDHYLHTAHRAALLLYPRRHPIALTPLSPAVTPESLTSHREATAWFTAEHPVLFAAIELAAGDGHDTHAWQLAWTLWDFLDRRGQWPELVAIQHTALTAAARSADRAGQAHSHHGLGFSYDVLQDHKHAVHHLQAALALFGELGDHTGQANICLSLCVQAYSEGDLRGSLSHADQALVLYRAAGDAFGQAAAHNNIAMLDVESNDPESALSHSVRAMEFYEEADDHHGRATGWDSLGLVHRHLGDYRRSIASYERARDIFHDLGDRRLEADTLCSVAGVHQQFDHPAEAREAWRRALRILEELGHPDAADVRAKLSS